MRLSCVQSLLQFLFLTTSCDVATCDFRFEHVRVHASGWTAGAVSQWPKNLVSPLSSSPHSSLQSTMSQDVVLSVGRSVAVGRGRSRSIDRSSYPRPRQARRVARFGRRSAGRQIGALPFRFSLALLDCSLRPTPAPTPFTAHATCSAMSETSRRTRTVASRDHILKWTTPMANICNPSHQSPFFYVLGNRDFSHIHNLHCISPVHRMSHQLDRSHRRKAKNMQKLFLKSIVICKVTRYKQGCAIRPNK